MNLAHLIVCGSIRLYRFVMSPLLHALLGPGCGCRFTPTCSEYALEAVRQHGAARGAWLALRRVGRCHPWGRAGLDPVPPGTADHNPAPLTPLPARPNHRGSPATIHHAAAPLNCSTKF